MGGITRFYLRLIHNDKPGPVAYVLQFVLWVLSGLYRVALFCRRSQFTLMGTRKSKAGCPVISVGNITWGGTGKTPLVRYLVWRLKELGFRPGVVSRAGEDEVTLLRETLNGVPVVVGRDRVYLARLIRERFNCNVLVLDDGFQDMRLKKDVEIVVLNSTMPFGNGELIPRGSLREPLARLRDADWILFNKIDLVTPARKAELAHQVRMYHAQVPIAESIYRVTGINHLVDGTILKSDEVQGRPVALLAAIADPAAFEETAQRLGAEVVHRIFLPDHHEYSSSDIGRAQEKAARAGADRILVTEKDAIKIKPFLVHKKFSGPSFYTVGIRLEITQGEEVLSGLLRALHSR